MRAIGLHAIVLLHAIPFTPNLSEDGSFPLETKHETKHASMSRATIDQFQLVMIHVLQFGMPHFFFIAGRVAAFNTAPPLQFSMKKSQRLMLSLLTSFLSFVPLGRYIGPLWFLVILTVSSYLLCPLMHWARLYLRPLITKQSRDPAVHHHLAVFISVCVGWHYLVLNSCFNLTTLGLLSLFAPYVGVISLILVLPSLVDSPLRHLTVVGIFLSPIIGQLLIVTYAAPNIFDDMANNDLPIPPYVLHLLRLCILHPLTYLTGFLTQLLQPLYQQSQPKWIAQAKPISTFALMVGLLVTLPSDPEQHGKLDWWPLYMAGGPENQRCKDMCLEKQLLFVSGAWLWIYLWSRFAQAFLNTKFSEWLHLHATSSGMLLYVSHITTMQVVISTAVVPFTPWTWPLACAVIFIGTLLLSYGLYALGLWYFLVLFRALGWVQIRSIKK